MTLYRLSTIPPLPTCISVYFCKSHFKLSIMKIICLIYNYDRYSSSHTSYGLRPSTHCMDQIGEQMVVGLTSWIFPVSAGTALGNTSRNGILFLVYFFRHRELYRVDFLLFTALALRPGTNLWVLIAKNGYPNVHWWNGQGVKDLPTIKGAFGWCPITWQPHVLLVNSKGYSGYRRINVSSQSGSNKPSEPSFSFPNAKVTQVTAWNCLWGKTVRMLRQNLCIYMFIICCAIFMKVISWSKRVRWSH